MMSSAKVWLVRSETVITVLLEVRLTATSVPVRLYSTQASEIRHQQQDICTLTDRVTTNTIRDVTL